jgi:hypothetical protein
LSSGIVGFLVIDPADLFGSRVLRFFSETTDVRKKHLGLADFTTKRRPASLSV